MTDAELQALELGTIVYEQCCSTLRKLIWDGKPAWFPESDGTLIYELCLAGDPEPVMGFCVRASDLHKTAEEAIAAIITADKSGWPLPQKALAEVLRLYRDGLPGDWVRAIGDEYMRGLES